MTSPNEKLEAAAEAFHTRHKFASECIPLCRQCASTVSFGAIKKESFKAGAQWARAENTSPNSAESADLVTAVKELKEVLTSQTFESVDDYAISLADAAWEMIWAFERSQKDKVDSEKAPESVANSIRETPPQVLPDESWFERNSKFIVNTVESLCWSDNWTVHKAIPMVKKILREAFEAGQRCSALQTKPLSIKDEE